MYIPPKNRNLRLIDLSPFESTLSDLASKYTECIISGYFNMDLISRSARTVAFLNTIQTMGFETIGSEPTHFTDTSFTCIDYFLITKQSQVKHNGQLDNIGYHIMI